jgi:hypothetical protein
MKPYMLQMVQAITWDIKKKCNVYILLWISELDGLDADDTSVIISNKNFDDFCATSYIILSHISKFVTHNSPQCA